MDHRFDTRLQHSIEPPASQPLTVDEFESHVDSGPYSTSETIQKAYAINYSPISLPNFQSPSYSRQEMIPVEYVGSTSLSERHPCRRKSASNANDEAESLSSMHLRRRAQNRASQRAFRERRERHVKALEDRLHRLHEQYRELLQSYARQSEEVGRLNDRIKELMAELETLKPENAMEFNNMALQHRSGNFDALPYPPAAFSDHPDPVSYLATPSSRPPG
ncbi:hypothetical protein D8B26_002709 [Coccidioides posadasii str. Silveira]|uniref:Predicted protein n=1 Tax=Coccidioides posadasii (strain RMSCC 757 / Silveira) TaxID=443226 RepID=E9CYJ5_COCPS|nr:predicted protein [Coccidioides posadasii str. Silveira]QVM08014.1 hypothetical protein D8B26_002709 [Coccidioides posadasii str. Silveira]